MISVKPVKKPRESYRRASALSREHRMFLTGAVAGNYFHAQAAQP
jgi:hypothetical protein